MDQDTFERLQKRGANARATGFTMIDNPFYAAAEMPAATGETIAEWELKAAAWEIGWRAEDLVEAA